MTHQRVDFFLLAMDQLINNAAKWNYMFGGQSSPVKIVIRAIIGRGWGQGPTHSQSFQSWFAHVPGLKVVAPFSPQDAKSLLLASVNDKSPVVFLEHRWLHQSVGLVSQDSSNCEIGKAQVVRRGRDVTIVGYSLMVAEAIRAAEVLSEIGIDAEVIDLRSLRPIDFSSVEDSVNKTGRLLALDLSHERFSVASEVVAHMAIHCFSKLQASPQRLGLPDYPAPTSPALTEGYYPGADEIVRTICKMLGKVVSIERFQNKNFRHHDVPGDWFRGPF